jgi:hypothetical protein
MPTIDNTYFFGELSLAYPDTPSGIANLQQIIDSREAELLQRLLGYSLYKAYKAAVALEVSDNPGPAVLLEQRFADLRDGKEYTNQSEVLTKWPGLRFSVGSSKKSLVANYVYWHYQADNYTFTTGSSEKKTDNAINTNPTDKMVRAWNEMVRWNTELHLFLSDHESVYPEYKNTVIDCELFTMKNRLGF